MSSHKQNKVRPDNRSGVPGIHWHTRDQHWIVRCFIDGKRFTLGYFKDFDKAVEARKAGERLKWKMLGQ